MPHSRYTALARFAAASTFITTFVLGCAPKPVTTAVSGERTLIEASADKVPAWVVREPASDRQFHYFRGIRTDAPTLEAGETDARQNALAGIVQFLGLRVTVDYRRLRTEQQTEIRDALRSVGGADIFGTRLSELFYRRWRVRERNEFQDRYDVYVLVRFPRASVERIKRNQQERLRNIERLMAGPGELYDQITGAAQALTAIDELNQSVLITTETVGQAEDLKRRAVVRLSRLIGGLHLSLTTSARKVTTGSQKTPLIVTAEVTTQEGGSGAPVPNVPVRITLGDTSHARLVRTDERGIARWNVVEIPMGTGTRTLSARVVLPEAVNGLPDVVRTGPTAAASLEIVPATQLVKLLVVVTERMAGRPSDRPQSEARLVEALRKKGFTVVSPSQTPADLAGLDLHANENSALVFADRVGATMLLMGTIETGEATPVELMSGLYLTTAQVRLVLTDIATSHVIATITLPDDAVPDTRGFGNTAERAAESALSLSRRGYPNGYDHIAELVYNAVRR